MLMISKENYCRRPSVLMALLALVSFFALSGSEKVVGESSPNQCCLCHQQVCEEVGKKRYVHAPVIEQNCVVCHVAANEVGSAAMTQSLGAIPEEEIQWLVKDYQLDTVHWVRLPANLSGRKILVRGTGEGQKQFQSEMVLPDLDGFKELPLAATPLAIKDLKVLEVKKGGFLTAKISWKTDRISSSSAAFGEKDLKSRTQLDPRLTTNHEVLLTGLAAGRNYRVAVISQDIFGDRAVSEELIFSTQVPFDAPTALSAPAPATLWVTGKYFKVKNDLYASFTGNQPFSILVGTSAQPAAPQPTVLSRGAGQLPADHLPLTDPYFYSIKVCSTCHPATSGVMSHPVDVFPKTGMKIPKDYKMLADGRLSCQTCHTAHASDNQYRLVKATQKKLCLGCHADIN